jgi:isopentenyl diphosphate isomerase/L-lactate dehydrogenase-like FMN-dependent dehydrogenase
MTYQEVLENARKNIAPKCKVCPDCNGVACAGMIPGPGGTGSGRSFQIAREFLKSVKVEMDAVHEAYDPDLSVELFGNTYKYPFFAAPIGGMPFNYNDYMTDYSYTEAIVKGSIEAGSISFTGDSANDQFFLDTMEIAKATGALQVPTIKPWRNDIVMHKMDLAVEAGVPAIAMDVDAAALINVKLMGGTVDPKPQKDIAELVRHTDKPFIVKGIMTAKSAIRCMDAGCYGVVVSNHGGRIIDDTPAPASLLPEIREAVGPDFKLFVDGGIRSGVDVFKCLALGADAVLIGRPYCIAAYGGGAEGVKLYTEKIATELSVIMMMTDCRTLADIDMSKIRFL